MRAPTAVAVLILAAGVAPSVALPLPGFTSAHTAPTPGVNTLVPRPQVKPLPNPATPPASRPTVVILEPRPRVPPALRPPTRVPSASEEERPELPPLPLYPPRGPYPPVGTTPVNPQARKSCFKKLWGKLCGNTLITTPPGDEVFGQPNVHPSVPRPSSRPLLERFDELLIEQRAYEDSEELPTTSIEDLQ